MYSNPQFPADLVTFTEEILYGEHHFLCSASFPKKPVPVDISVETSSFKNIKTLVCYRERIEDVATQLALVKALFMNESSELKNYIAEPKYQISEVDHSNTKL